MNALRAVRLAAWAAVGVAAIVLALVVLRPFGVEMFGGGSPLPNMASASIGGPFKLVDNKGETVTEQSLKGHPTAMFFGYTFCPYVCPTTLTEMTALMEKLGPAADKLKVYFVTVDPERDTEEQLSAYLDAFDPRFRGLTGDRPAIDEMLKAYRVYSKKVEGGDPEYYLMDHTASVYLLDTDGKFVGTLAYQEKEETALAKLKQLVGS